MKSINSFFKLSKAYSVGIIALVQLIILTLGVYGVKYILAISFKSVFDNMDNLVINDLITTTIFVFFAIFIFSLFSYLLKIMKIKTSAKINLDIQNKILEKASKMELREFEKVKQGDWQTYLYDDATTVSNFTNDTILLIVMGIVEFGLAFYYGVTNSITLTLIILGLTLLSIILPSKLSARIEKAQRVRYEEVGNINDMVLDFAKNSIIIKSILANDFIIKMFGKHYDEYANSSVEAKKAEALVGSVSVTSGFFIGAVWMIIGIYLISIGHITLGIFFGFITLHDNFSWPFYNLSGLVNSYKTCKVSSERINEFLSLKEEFGEVSDVENKDSVKPLLSGQNLSYEYSDLTLKYKDFELNRGDKVQLAGESGSGKSTLVNMLTGLYQCENIKLVADDKVYTGNQIYNKIAYVPQEPLLFSDTIFNNIVYGLDRTVDLKEVIEVCKKVNAHTFIEKFENGYDTKIGVGCDTQLSTGQKQRISIARALIKEASLYFFDEVTSALDDENEEQIVGMINKEVESFVMITHKEKGKSICTKNFIVAQ